MGEQKLIIRKTYEHECWACAAEATYCNTYLDHSQGNPRANPASKAYGKDNISWCADYEQFLCSEHHAANYKDDVPEGFEWCSTFEKAKFEHMFRFTRDTEVSSVAEASPAIKEMAEALEPFARYAEISLKHHPRNDGWGLDVGTDREAVVNREDFARLLAALSTYRKAEGGE